MKCSNPFVKGRHAFGCGQCMPCRINKRRVWSHRIMLEASQYSDNNFVTLTYDEEHLPEDGSVSVRELQLFFKRLRISLGDKKIRYFAVGEYGDETWRPHYHVALFNYPRCRFGQSNYGHSGRCCSVCDHLRKVWSLGNVYSGLLEPDSATYIAGYTTKKLTKADDERLKGRSPEFARMSLRPGIGAGFVPEVASALLQYGLEKQGDVPAALRHGPKLLPLGRYLRRKLREQVGMEAKAPASTLAQMERELSELYEKAREIGAKSGTVKETFKNMIIDAGEQSRRNLESRNKIFKKRGSI